MRPSLPVRHWTVRRNAGRRSSAWRAAPGPALAGKHHVAHTQLVQGIVDAFLPVAAVGGDGSRFASGATDDSFDGRASCGASAGLPCPVPPDRRGLGL